MLVQFIKPQIYLTLMYAVLFIVLFQGFVAVTIQANDYSNGLIGFTDPSLYVTADEDVPSPAISLQLRRRNAFYGEVQVCCLCNRTSSCEAL